MAKASRLPRTFQRAVDKRLELPRFSSSRKHTMPVASHLYRGTGCNNAWRRPRLLVMSSCHAPHHVSDAPVAADCSS
eukprot:scaffold343667_cov27-Prasinocladus_malaysianus.AAC.1